jgi:hypothetical protein
MLKKKLHFWILGCVALILFLVAMIGSSSFQECAKCAYTTQHQQYSSSPIFAFITTFLDWTRLTCVGIFFSDAHEEILAAFTILLAIFTFALWVSTSKLARDAEIASAKTINIMENTAKKELRAYVGQESVSISYIPNGKRIEIVIKNFGKTIAKKVVINILVSTPHVINEGGNNSGVQSVGSYINRPNITDIGVVMPNGTWTIRTDFERAEENIEIFINGKIDYIDVFDDPQWTTFNFKGRKSVTTDSWITEATKVGDQKDTNNAT